MLSLTDNGRTTVVWGDFKCTLDLAFDRVLSFLQVIEIPLVQMKKRSKPFSYS